MTETRNDYNILVGETLGKRCEIWVFSSDDSDRCSLNCGDVYWYGRIPLFRRKLLPPSSLLFHFIL